jgi:GH15 family glucan-1,4-alpha-glucosidase
VRDIYFPHVGQENHLLGHAQRVGVYVEGRLSWINEEGWERSLGYKNDTLVTENKATNGDLGVDLLLEENVFCEADIFLRKITIRNLEDSDREFRVFFHNDFHLYGDGIGDTAVYQMDHNVVVHYKRARYFLIGVLKSGEGGSSKSDLDDYAIGLAESDGFEGTFRDAEDGVLSKNPVTQGRVDSTVGVVLQIPAEGEETIYYCMTAGMNFKEVYKLNNLILEEGPEALMQHAEGCQRSWVNDTTTDLSGLDEDLASLYRRSLLIIKTQTDSDGAILAANDSDNTVFNRDTYSYMWARDGALASLAMIRAGFPGFAKPFFRFCKDVLWWTGCLLHKYNPDGTLGSSWHPWVEDGAPALPIQEDETALVIYALWEYYRSTEDLEFIREVYDPLVKKAAEFMNDYRYPNGMPMKSYDLWEEDRGVFAFTASAVYAGLNAAENLAQLFGDTTICELCKLGYGEIKDLILSELYDPKERTILRGLKYEGRDVHKKRLDYTVDSSVYAIFEFGVLPADDPRVVRTMENVEQKLWVDGIGGLARYQGDLYRRQVHEGVGNPWPICTLWLAKWYIAQAKGDEDLRRAYDLIRWAADCSLETGIMPEQVHPITGESVSVAPLTWSHAEFIDAVTNFIEKKVELGIDLS